MTREDIGLFDIRWHNAESHLLGHYVLRGSEREAREYAVGKFSWLNVATVRVVVGSKFLYTFRRG